MFNFMYIIILIMRAILITHFHISFNQLIAFKLFYLQFIIITFFTFNNMQMRM